MTLPMTTTLQSQLDDYWTGRAEAYHANQVESDRAPLDRSVWHRVFTQALPAASSRILDVGTGSGYLAHVLAELGHHVTGLDSSTGMINTARAEAARRRDAGAPAAEFMRGDAVAPEVPAGSVDVVTSRYVLWTLRDPAAALRAWSRLVGPGGLVACVDAAWFPHGISEETVVDSEDGPDAFTRAYSPTTLDRLPLATVTDATAFADLFTQAGLTNVMVTPIPEIADLDQRFGLSPGHESCLQVLVTGIVPSGPGRPCTPVG